MGMKIGVPREVHAGERRVAATPETVQQIIKLGFAVSIEAGAGQAANFADAAYAAAGATVVADVRALYADADIILKVRAPESLPALGIHEAALLHPGQTLLSFIWPAQNADLMALLAASGATVIAMDAVPRISRAQKLDALSSICLLYTSPSPRDGLLSRMPSSA